MLFHYYIFPCQCTNDVQLWVMSFNFSFIFGDFSRLLGLWSLSLAPLSTIFQLLNIVAVSFIVGGNQSTRGKITNLSQVTDKTLSYNVVSSTPCLERDSKSKTLVLKGTDCTGTCTFVNPTIIRSRP